MAGEAIAGQSANGGSVESKHPSSRKIPMKTIGDWGSFVLLVNNMMSHGLVVMPLAYQHTGWLGMIIMIGLCSYMSSFGISFLAEAMSIIPGNERFQGRVTFMRICETYLSKRSAAIALALFLTWIVVSNTSAIVLTAQTADQAMLSSGAACALEYYPQFRFKCITQGAKEDSVFGNSWVLSLGFVLTSCITIPFSLVDIRENMMAQSVTFIGIFVIMVTWTSFFLSKDLEDSRVPVIGQSGRGVGFVLFNFAYVVYAPAWINEKRSTVDIESILVWSTLLGAMVFMVPCLLGAVALDFSNGQDLLALLTLKSTPVWVQICTYTYPLFETLSSIPIFSIIMRYNLVENKICSFKWAIFWSVCLPWVIALPFYAGDMVNAIVSWTGILIAGPTNLIIPALIYLAVSRKRKELLSSSRKAGRSPASSAPAPLLLDRKRQHYEDDGDNNDFGDDEKRLLEDPQNSEDDDEYDSFAPTARSSSSSESYVALPVEWEVTRKLMAHGIIAVTASVMVYAATVEGIYGVKKEF